MMLGPSEDYYMRNISHPPQYGHVPQTQSRSHIHELAQRELATGTARQQSSAVHTHSFPLGPSSAIPPCDIYQLQVALKMLLKAHVSCL